MKVLVLGSGGREHALAWKLAQAERVSQVFVAPGNGGTARDPLLTNVPLTDVRALAAFVAPGVVAITDPASGPAAAKVAGHLARPRDAQGNVLGLVRLPAAPPAPQPLSYTQFLPVNGGLLVPAFDLAGDARAADILAEHLTDRRVQLVPMAPLIAAGINLTAATLPQPARLLERERATVLPRSAWSQPVYDVEELLQHYIDLADSNE